MRRVRVDTKMSRKEAERLAEDDVVAGGRQPATTVLLDESDVMLDEIDLLLTETFVLTDYLQWDGE